MYYTYEVTENYVKEFQMAKDFNIYLSLEADLNDAIISKAEADKRSPPEIVRGILREYFFKEKAEGKFIGVGELAEHLLLEGLTNEEVLERVQADFPTASTTLKAISWYRAKLKKDGVDVIGQVEAKRRRANKS